jgi:uncharacterized damage-inducible protein DinB
VSIEALRAEFAGETKKTRKQLERLRDDVLEWRPHPKSSTVRGLGSHLVEVMRWTDAIFGADEFNFERGAIEFSAASVAHLLETYDADVARSAARLEKATDADLARPWKFSIFGKERWTKPKEFALRNLSLNHMVHHRGQLSVYLRLLDIPVPGAFGPSADEM